MDGYASFVIWDLSRFLSALTSPSFIPMYQSVPVTLNVIYDKCADDALLQLCDI